MDAQAPILVTGATGFVGQYLIAELLRRGHTVRGTVRDLARAEQVHAAVGTILGDAAAGEGLELVACDLLDDAGWSEAMDGARAVCHTAMPVFAGEPKDPELVIRPAVEGTERVLRAAHTAGIRRMVYTSSVATIGYGHPKERPTRFSGADWTRLDGPTRKWSYCVAKTTAERQAWALAGQLGIDFTSVHPGMILGPAVSADYSVSLELVRAMLAGEMPAAPDTGFATVDVRDVAALHAAALFEPRAYSQRLLATGGFLHFLDVARILASAHGDRKLPKKTVPNWLLRAMVPFNPTLRQIVADLGLRKEYDNSLSQTVMARPFMSGEQMVLDTARSLIDLGLVSPKK